MTWKRVATAAVLIPFVIAIVLFTPTWAVAIATALITILALREYFALGDAIGHRAYRLWTIFCSLFLFRSRFGSFPSTWRASFAKGCIVRNVHTRSSILR